MRIAIVGKKFPFCGIVTYCREQVRYLRARGHEVAFFYLHNDEVREDDEDGVPYLLRTPLYTLPAPGARARLRERLSAFQPDVVHASFALSFLDLWLPGLCQELGTPLVATFHVAFDTRLTWPNAISAFGYRFYAQALSRCQRVIVFSEPQRARLERVGVPAGRLEILPNGVDTRRYHPGPSRFKAEIAAGTLLTFMGRLDPEKNVGALLAAFIALEAPDDVHLAIMGDGVLGARLRQKYGEHPRVHWLGFVADEQTRIDVLRGSDLFVLPSSVEGLSLALLEAMACGAAPVATDVGGDGEVVEGCGLLLDPRGVREQLELALGQLLADPQAVAEYRRLAARRVARRYALDQNMARLEAIYEEAVRARAVRARWTDPRGVTIKGR